MVTIDQLNKNNPTLFITAEAVGNKIHSQEVTLILLTASKWLGINYVLINFYNLKLRYCMHLRVLKKNNTYDKKYLLHHMWLRNALVG